MIEKITGHALLVFVTRFMLLEKSMWRHLRTADTKTAQFTSIKSMEIPGKKFAVATSKDKLNFWNKYILEWGNGRNMPLFTNVDYKYFLR